MWTAIQEIHYLTEPPPTVEFINSRVDWTLIGLSTNIHPDYLHGVYIPEEHTCYVYTRHVDVDPIRLLIHEMLHAAGFTHPGASRDSPFLSDEERTAWIAYEGLIDEIYAEVYE